ncbi:hypothetical protein A2955_02260 [Candidatus Woesebacteria bacterium RIFCSPLOWO2_01_FULL_37_19]|uniref:Methyltransferase domain-containing protein n=1 Tax=Candidatus Woesebacteria bacterium RIFCSPLOWO2_01_FULL_37_19 TaxID=1802514 RepID=A0A1F8BAY4_9BACT|nr:MAG: hypothetical protein A2955_02260 [Candidatus Woesebacteria bacterium RIFCSPLOWO2_01_FULL_37_19]
MISDEERWDETHKKSHNPEEIHSVYAEEKEKLFPRGSLVVDLGGGTGGDALYFLQKGHSVVILDISSFALGIAQAKAKKHNLQEKLAVKQVDFGLHALPIKPDSADVAYSRISLHYYGKNHTTKLFIYIYEILKPGGTAYLTFKSPEDIEEMDYLRNIGVEYEPNVYIENGQLRSRFDVDQLKSMVAQADITNFEVKPYKEELRDKHGLKTALLVNEVSFKKV